MGKKGPATRTSRSHSLRSSPYPTLFRSGNPSPDLQLLSRSLMRVRVLSRRVGALSEPVPIVRNYVYRSGCQGCHHDENGIEELNLRLLLHLQTMISRQQTAEALDLSTRSRSLLSSFLIIAACLPLDEVEIISEEQQAPFDLLLLLVRRSCCPSSIMNRRLI